MGLTRKALAAMGIEAEKVDQIIEMHTETLEAIKAERDSAREDLKKFKADSEKLSDVQKELAELKAKTDQPDVYKEKYEKVKKDFDDYKGEITAKETKAAKEKAYRAMLKEVGVSDKRLDTVMKASVGTIDSVELDDEGNLKNVDELKNNAKTEWADFIVSTGTKGASTPTPPANTGGAKTKDEIMAIKDTSKRQAAIAENHELFGL